MGRGKRWTDAENALLLEMVEQGLDLGAIVKSGRFYGRTPQAIAKRMKRLTGDSFVRQNKKFIVGQIGKAEKPKLLLLRLFHVKSLIFDTQQLRRRLMQSLQELFEEASRMAEGDPSAMKVAGYIAQILNNVAKSYEERQLNDDLKLLEELIQEAKRKAGEEGGVEIRPSSF